jgi:hypothetical protein
MLHSRHCIGIVRQRLGFSESLPYRRVMTLTIYCYIRHYLFGFTLLDVGFAVVAAVGYYGIYFPKLSG